MRGTILRFKAERDALAADARRYRWLRECSPVRSDRTITIRMALYHDGYCVGSDYISGDALDAAIDALAAREG